MPQISHFHKYRNFSCIFVSFLDQLLHLYKFNGRDMSGILFFIFELAQIFISTNSAGPLSKCDLSITPSGSEKGKWKKFTRSERRASEQDQTKSAISDHAAIETQVINWDDTKILGKEHDKKAREVGEATEIRRRGAKMLNKEEGTYLLSHIYDPLIKRTFAGKEISSHQRSITRQSGSDGHSDEVSQRSEMKY